MNSGPWKSNRCSNQLSHLSSPVLSYNYQLSDLESEREKNPNKQKTKPKTQQNPQPTEERGQSCLCVQPHPLKKLSRHPTFYLILIHVLAVPFLAGPRLFPRVQSEALKAIINHSSVTITICIHLSNHSLQKLPPTNSSKSV